MTCYQYFLENPTAPDYCLDYYINYYCEIPNAPAEYAKGLPYRYELTQADSTQKAPNKPNTTNLKSKYDPWVNCFCSVFVIAFGGKIGRAHV